MKKAFFSVSVSIFLCTAAVVIGYIGFDLREKNEEESSIKVRGDLLTVIIDAGHGGDDPGTVVDGVEEAEINLKIAELLREKLVAAGFNVVMSRESDEGLFLDGENEWKKINDMKARRNIIDNSGACLCVSIHQNYYSDVSVKGAQVFFSMCLAENERLAQILQQKLSEVAHFENTRSSLRDDEMLVLKNCPMPAAIVECGFLSNDSERALLVTEEYQREIAEAVFQGIYVFLSTQNEGEGI